MSQANYSSFCEHEEESALTCEYCCTWLEDTQVTDTQAFATLDTNERHAQAQAKALECLQTMCAKDNGTLTITPNGWSFTFNKAG